MVYFFTIDEKFYAILTWVLVVTVSTNAKLKPLTDEALLTNFIKQYVQPYVESHTNLTKLALRNRYIGKTSTDIEKFVIKTVKELKPFLQDDTVEDDKLTLEGEDETTIIEFIPHLRNDKGHTVQEKLIETKARDFQENLQKYKKLRSKIRKALKREKITSKTKNLVTKTLDKMIAQMIAHRCTWKDTVYRGSLMENTTDDKGASMLIKTWNKLWHKLKDQYKSKNMTKEVHDTEVQKDIFLNKFQDLISLMTNDLNTIISKYKVVCKLENLKGKDGSKDKMHPRAKLEEKGFSILDEANNYLTQQGISDLKTAAENAIVSNKFEDKLPCENFKICSDELKDFLLDFYITLNDTTIVTINNYAAMFLRDVSDDGYHEKERVVDLIKNISNTYEKKIDTIYRKHTKMLKLDPEKNQYINVKVLNKYITDTIQHVKKALHNHIESHLTSVRNKLMSNIQKDIDVNIELDLGNLERDISGRICQIFEICNGRVFSARKNNYIGDKNNVYVKVELNLEEDVETRRIETTSVARQTRYKQLRVIVTKSPLKYNVTRTTRIESVVTKPFKSSNDKIEPQKHLLEKIDHVTDTEPSIVLNVSESIQHITNQSLRKLLKDVDVQSVTVKITLIDPNEQVKGIPKIYKQDKEIKPFKNDKEKTHKKHKTDHEIISHRKHKLDDEKPLKKHKDDKKGQLYKKQRENTENALFRETQDIEIPLKNPKSKKKLKRSQMRNLRRIEFNRQMRLNLAEKIKKNNNKKQVYY